MNQTAVPGSTLAGRRVLVTGASGFIGGHLCRSLATIGAEIHAVSRIDRPRSPDGARWWRADLADLDAVRRTLAAVRPSVIFHLAGYVTGSQELAQVMPMFRNNLQVQVNLLTAAQEAGCDRILFTGSEKEPRLDSGDIDLCSPYAVAKWASAGYARMFHALYGTPVVHLRVFMTYGPAQPDTLKLVPYVILSLLRGESPRVGSGRLESDWIFVSDVVEGLIAAAVSPQALGRTLDIGTGTITSVRSVIEQIVELVDARVEPTFGALADRALEPVRVAATDETYALIGWRAGTPLAEGLARTVEWYREMAEREELPTHE